MRLSDISGDRVLDVVADLIGPISRVAHDEAIRSLMKPQGVPEGRDAREVAAERLTEAIPVIIKGHKGDIIAILATINGKTTEEYAGDMTLASLISDAVELATDEVFTGFLASQMGMSSGSA